MAAESVLQRRIGSIRGRSRRDPQPPETKPGTASGRPAEHQGPPAFTVNVGWAKSSRSLLDLVSSVDGLRVDGRDNAQGHVVWVVGPFDLEQALLRRRSKARVSRIPGMHELCKKGAFERMARHLRSQTPSALSTVPRTWLIPEEQVPRSAFNAGPCLFKPECGTQGTGIYFVHSGAEAARRAAASFGRQQGVLQRYVGDPLLLDGKKFDLRVYALVLSLEPLRVFVAREGLARVCCDEYHPPARGNLFKGSSHLTNYGVNKHRAGFDFHDDPSDGTRGTKRCMKSTLEHLADQGAGDLWPAVRDCAAEAAIALGRACAGADTGVDLWPATEPPLPPRESVWGDHRWRGWQRDCFQLLGIDVLLTEDGRPVLLEANACPSLGIDAVVDRSCNAAPPPRPAADAVAAARPAAAAGGPEWWKPVVAASGQLMRGKGRQCRCTASVKPHSHTPCAVDIAAKYSAVSGALKIIQRDQQSEAAGLPPPTSAQLAAGTVYQAVL
eukprot:TRINITY_DN25785_c0_g1_i1.p1 TRINITY_DN25785_c0_g1~~TRINITY_DN25785_c0_g1_i1.p1  ORF type:complete len:521 (+),score=152.74 TRINITY_DN25785_c0_g1_i1:72-1565(+)